MQRVRRAARAVFLAILIFIVAPSVAGAAWFYARGWPASWRDADWSSAALAPDPTKSHEAIVQIYAARAGRWKGVFAVHSWIVTKSAGAKQYTRYDVVGWGPPVRRNAYVPDGKWYSNMPAIIYELRGEVAERAIGKINQAVAAYPFSARGSYVIWPGPNSNTFVAWVARHVPELEVELPATAIGKDYLGAGFQTAVTPSNSGWQFALGGLIGAAIGKREGVELHLLGATLGIDLLELAIKLPAIGRISLIDLYRHTADGIQFSGLPKRFVGFANDHVAGNTDILEQVLRFRQECS